MPSASTQQNSRAFAEGAEIFRWGPVPLKYFYMSEFLYVLRNDFLDAFPDYVWPHTLLLFHNDGRGLWLNDLDELYAAGGRLFQSYMLDPMQRESLYNEWERAKDALIHIHSEIEEYIAGVQTTFESLSSEEFQFIWDKFFSSLIDFWVPVIVPEFANYGSTRVLEEALIPYIQEEKELAAAMEVLTAPDRLSFYQIEEIDLAETDDIAAHTSQYYWIQNSYAGTEVLDEAYFTARQKEVPQDIRLQMEKRLKMVKERKKELALKYGLSEEVLLIASAISVGIEWQDHRKGYLLQNLHYKTVLAQEAARRLHMHFDDILRCGFYEVSSLLQGTQIQPAVSERVHGYGLDLPQAAVATSPVGFGTRDQQELWEQYATEKLSEEISQLNGTVASTGAEEKVTGQVQIVLDPKKADDFPAGAILVAPMTSPEYVFLMKKAAAIITDTGGLTSHAAVVSRELNVPCVVNTKYATSVLQNGNTVEIHTREGLIKKV